MSGLVIKVLKNEGDPVKAGETLLILEAMKMQNQIRAGHDCTVKKVLVRPGQPVEKGEKMVILEA
jgi:biotin carboxyl carrier protein